MNNSHVRKISFISSLETLLKSNNTSEEVEDEEV
jgi:hypothetical protein